MAETGLAAAATGALIMANTSKNAEQGYERGKTSKSATDHGKNEKHGDGGRGYSKSKSRVDELEKAKRNVSTKKERERIMGIFGAKSMSMKIMKLSIEPLFLIILYLWIAPVPA